MNRLFHTLFLAAALGIPAASAVNYESKGPGLLAGEFTDPSAVLVLKVTGPIDASDMSFIEQSMPALTSLDLSGAEIRAYSGKSIRGIGEYPANTIPAGAFARTGLTNVVLPATAGLKVGDAAFAGSALESVSISTPGAIIGAGAFSACPELVSASVSGAELDSHVFAACPALGTVRLTGVSAIPASAFEGCTTLSELSGEEGAATIGARAFAGCPALASFDFGAGLTEIGAGAFEDCGLTEASMTASKKLASIGDWAFKGDASLTTVALPASVTSIGRGAFFECPELHDVRYSSGAKEIPAYAFKGSAKVDPSGVLTEGVESVGEYALKDVTGASYIHIPASVGSIGTGAMEGMTGLEKINVQHVTAVPALGEDVWKGVDKENVELQVLDTMSEDFKAADQWRDFKFLVTTGINDVVSPADSGSSLEGRFAGTELQLRSLGREIERVDLYRADGTLVLTETPGSATVSIPTESIGGRIFIVECALSDGSRAALKLLR